MLEEACLFGVEKVLLGIDEVAAAGLVNLVGVVLAGCLVPGPLILFETAAPTPDRSAVMRVFSCIKAGVDPTGRRDIVGVLGIFDKAALPGEPVVARGRADELCCKFFGFVGVPRSFGIVIPCRTVEWLSGIDDSSLELTGPQNSGLTTLKDQRLVFCTSCTSPCKFEIEPESVSTFLLRSKGCGFMASTAMSLPITSKFMNPTCRICIQSLEILATCSLSQFRI